MSGARPVPAPWRRCTRLEPAAARAIQRHGQDHGLVDLRMIQGKIAWWRCRPPPPDPPFDPISRCAGLSGHGRPHQGSYPQQRLTTYARAPSSKPPARIRRQRADCHPDEQRGQMPKLLVTLQQGKTTTPAEVQRFLAVPPRNIKMPKVIEIRSELPGPWLPSCQEKNLPPTKI